MRRPAGHTRNHTSLPHASCRPRMCSPSRSSGSGLHCFSRGMVVRDAMTEYENAVNSNFLSGRCPWGPNSAES
eukprot:6793594-Alexandrium_andersonii.AAC.1